MHAPDGVPISIQHVPRAAVLGLHLDSCRGEAEPQFDGTPAARLLGAAQELRH